MTKRETGTAIQAVFIDRDGTIGGTGHFVHPNHFEVFPCVHEALSLLKSHGLNDSSGYEESLCPTNASIACVDNGCVLLIERGPDDQSFAGFWEFPGGSIEPGETPVEAAVREFREECGTDVVLGRQIATFSWMADGGQKTEVVFSGRATGPIALGHDHCSYAWVGRDDLVEGRYKCSQQVRSIAIGLCCSDE